MNTITNENREIFDIDYNIKTQINDFLETIRTKDLKNGRYPRCLKNKNAILQVTEIVLDNIRWETGDIWENLYDFYISDNKIVIYEVGYELLEDEKLKLVIQYYSNLEGQEQPEKKYYPTQEVQESNSAFPYVLGLVLLALALLLTQIDKF